MGYDGSFANNFNLSLLIEIGICLMMAMFYFLGERRMLRIFRQCAFMMVILCASQLFFSFSLIKSLTMIDIGFSTVALGCFFAQYMQMCKDSMENIFISSRQFFAVYFLCRFALCFIMGLVTQDNLLTCLLAMTVQFLFISYLFWQRPFLN